VTNKVTHIINCAGNQVKNMWESIGVIYLTFGWQENDKEVLFDRDNRNINRAYEFIENSKSKGESCLIHS